MKDTCTFIGGRWLSGGFIYLPGYSIAGGGMYWWSCERKKTREMWMPELYTDAEFLVRGTVGVAVPKDMWAKWMPMHNYWNSISSALCKSIWHRTDSEVNVLIHLYGNWIQWMNNKLVMSRTMGLVAQRVPTFDLSYQQEQGSQACYTSGFVPFHFNLHPISYSCIILSRLFCLLWQCCASPVWCSLKTQE